VSDKQSEKEKLILFFVSRATTITKEKHAKY
jgi:hypothetical protein